MIALSYCSLLRKLSQTTKECCSKAMSEIVNPKNLNWVSKNKALALIIVLLYGNVHQYINTMKLNEKHAIEVQNWAKSKELQTEKSLEYERQRSEKLEYLLNNLSKYAPK